MKRIFKNLEQQIDTSQTWYNTQDIIESNKGIDNNNKKRKKTDDKNWIQFCLHISIREKKRTLSFPFWFN
jgi:hypothetical protein